MRLTFCFSSGYSLSTQTANPPSLQYRDLEGVTNWLNNEGKKFFVFDDLRVSDEFQHCCITWLMSSFRATFGWKSLLLLADLSLDIESTIGSSHRGEAEYKLRILNYLNTMKIILLNKYLLFFFSFWAQTYRQQRPQQQRRQLPQQQRTFRGSQFLDRQAHRPRCEPPIHAPQPSFQLWLIQGKYIRGRLPTSSQQRVKAPCSQAKHGQREENTPRHCPTPVCVQTEAYQTEDQKRCCKIILVVIC